MAVDAVVETDERICLRLINPELKLRPELRPENCGDCYKCERDPIKNPGCSGNPKNYDYRCLPESYIG